MREGRVRIRMTLTHNKDDYRVVDYAAQNAREFNALKGIELIEAKVNRDGELVAIFDVSASDEAAIEKGLRSFADALLADGEEPETVKFETLGGDIEPLPDRKVLQMPGLSDE